MGYRRLLNHGCQRTEPYKINIPHSNRIIRFPGFFANSEPFLLSSGFPAVITFCRLSGQKCFSASCVLNGPGVFSLTGKLGFSCSGSCSPAFFYHMLQYCRDMPHRKKQVSYHKARFFTLNFQVLPYGKEAYKKSDPNA